MVPSTAIATSAGELNRADKAGPFTKPAVPLPPTVVTTHCFTVREVDSDPWANCSFSRISFLQLMLVNTVTAAAIQIIF